MMNLNLQLKEIFNVDEFYVPQKGDIILRIVGEVINPHNKFGEEIMYKRIVRHILIKDKRIHTPPSLDKWWWGYWEVHKCLTTSWIENVEPDIEIETPVIEIGEFLGLGKHNEEIKKSWGSLPDDYIYVGSDVNNDRTISYYVPSNIIDKICHFYREKRNFKNTFPNRESFVYLGYVILCEPWGLKK
jgi:hypothetical protein